MMKNNLMSFAIGLAAGSFGGLIGLGGGLIMIPLMIGVLKLSQHQAHGTSLVALIFTGIAGASVYGLQGNLDFPAAGALAITSVATARAGAHFANTLPGWKLRRAFGAFLILCSALMVIKPYLHDIGSNHPFYINLGIFLITGTVTGFLSGMMGVGGGAIMVPAMVLLAGFGQHMAQGTSLLVMVPLGASGATAHRQLGNIAIRFLPGLIPGILLGTLLGGNVANFIPDTPLRLAFIAAIIFMGVSYTRSKAPE